MTNPEMAFVLIAVFVGLVTLLVTGICIYALRK